MALDGNDLGTAIDSAIQGMTEENRRDSLKIWKEVGIAIVNYITANAEVSTTVASGIAVQVVPATGTGATTATGAGTGTVS